MDSFRAQGWGIWRSIFGTKRCATTKYEKKVTQSPQNPEEKLKDMDHKADETIIGSPLNKLKEPAVQDLSITKSNCSSKIIVEEPADEKEADAGNKDKKMSPKLAHEDCDINANATTKKTNAWSKLSVGQFLRKKETSNKNLTYDDPLLSTITHDTILIPPVGHLKGLLISHLQSLAVDGAWLDAEVMDYVGFLALKKYASDNIGKIVVLPHSLCFYFGSHLNSWIENETVKTLSLQQITGKTEIIYFVLFLDYHFVLIKFNKINATEWTTTVFDPLENQANAELVTIGIELVSNIIEQQLKTVEPGVQHHNDWQRNATIKIPGGNCRDCGPGVLWSLEKELKAIESGPPMDYEKFEGQNLKLYRHQILMDLLLESDVGRLIIQKCCNDAQSIAKFVQYANDQIKNGPANVDGNNVKPKHKG